MKSHVYVNYWTGEEIESLYMAVDVEVLTANMTKPQPYLVGTVNGQYRAIRTPQIISIEK